MDLPPLPNHRHLPGLNARHAEDAFDQIRRRALVPTTSETAQANPAWLYGLRLLEAGFWWEAHEVLEPVWMNAVPNSAERHLVQGVIQLANAALKHQIERPKAALRLCDASEELLRAAGPDDVMGLRIDLILREVTRLRLAVQSSDGEPLRGIILHNNC